MMQSIGDIASKNSLGFKPLELFFSSVLCLPVFYIVFNAIIPITLSEYMINIIRIVLTAIITLVQKTSQLAIVDDKSRFFVIKFSETIQTMIDEMPVKVISELIQFL